MDESGDRRDRGISEVASTLALVAVTLTIVAAVGVNVVFVEGDSTAGPDAAFSFDYFDEQKTLLIEHAGGDPVRADRLLIRGPEAEVTWAQTNDNIDNSTMIGRSSNTTQISSSGAYGAPVGSNTNIDIVYINRTSNTTQVLGQWNGTS